MTREELRDYVEEQRNLNMIPYHVYSALIDGIDMLEQEPKWIPVSEKLPEEKQSVLVWCPEYKNMYCAYLENKNWWIFGAFSQIIPNAVIAWMPLPKPYEPQESEEKE